jgi:hypothetical protein
LLFPHPFVEVTLCGALPSFFFVLYLALVRPMQAGFSGTWHTLCAIAVVFLFQTFDALDGKQVSFVSFVRLGISDVG